MESGFTGSTSNRKLLSLKRIFAGVRDTFANLHTAGPFPKRRMQKRCNLQLPTSITCRCYDYVIPKRKLTWLEAALSCVERGGHLASLETPEEWTAVLDALSIRSSVHRVYFGLEAATQNTTTMYATLMTRELKD